MTPEELYKQRLREVELMRVLYNQAKADYRKALLANVSNKLLSPFKKASKEISIVKSRMIREYESKREDLLKKQIELLEKKDKRLEDAVKYIENVKDDVKKFGNDTKENVGILFNDNLQRSEDTIDFLKRKGGNVISGASCFMGNVKNSLIASLDNKTTLHRDIESKILDMKMDKVSRDYKRALDESKNRQIQEMVERSIEKERSFGESDTIRARFNKINKNKSYMGTATNRVVDYFRSKKNKLDDKIFDAKVNMAYANSVVTLKASRTKSKIATAFNSQINNLKNKADNFIGNTMVAASNTYNNIKEGINDKISDISSAIEHRNEVKQRKEDIITALNEEEKRKNEIKKAQLEMRRNLIANINNGNIFDDAIPVIESGMRK